MLDHNSLVFFGIGLISYGLARISIDSFYTRLNVTAEEVGLNQTIIVTRSALYAVFIPSAIAVSMLVGTNLPTPRKTFDNFGVDVSAGRTYDRLLVLAALLAGLDIALVAAWRSLPIRHSLWILAIWLVGGSLLVYATRLPRINSAAKTLLYRDTKQWHGWATVCSLLAWFIIVGICVGAILLLFAVPKARGRDLAACVRHGKTVEEHKWELLAINAQPVYVQWIGAPQRGGPKEGVAFMRLGETDGTLVLYDFRTEKQAPLRIPASDVILIGTGDTATKRIC
jgi:hypothetical protein